VILQTAAALTVVLAILDMFTMQHGFGKRAYLSLMPLEVLYFGWVLAVGSFLNAQVPVNLPRHWLPPLLAFAFAGGYLLTADYLFREFNFSRPVMALHLVAMFANFYLLWYISRALIAAEEQATPSISRVLGVFLILWVTLPLPVGAYWVHNRARQMIGGGGSPNHSLQRTRP
jgi:hypothetical protein